MAPQNLVGLYGCIDGIGRIQTAALHPDRAMETTYEESGAVRVVWPLPAGGRLRRVTVYEDAAGTVSGRPRRTRRIRDVLAMMVDNRICCKIDDLPKDRKCSIVAEAVIDNRPDLPVIIRTKSIQLEGRKVHGAR